MLSCRLSRPKQERNPSGPAQGWENLLPAPPVFLLPAQNISSLTDFKIHI